jgi:hypothetical protein
VANDACITKKKWFLCLQMERWEQAPTVRMGFSPSALWLMMPVTQKMVVSVLADGAGEEI